MKPLIFKVFLCVFSVGCSANAGFAQRAASGDDHKADVKTATKAALKWLELIDAGKYAESWDEASEFFKTNTPKETWIETLEDLMPQFGENKTRESDGSRFMTKMPGGPDGEYVMLRFSSTFEKKEEATETVTPAKDENGKWRVSGYYIR